MKCWDLCRCLTTTVIRVTTSFTNGGNFHPKPWGFMESQFDGCIFLDMGGSKKPSTRLKMFKRPWPSLLRQERDLVLLDVRDVAEHLGDFFGGCEALPRLEGSSFNQEKNILQETS